MATFLDIFARVGATEMARRIGFDDPNTVHAWKRTGSIPSPHWKALADAGIATLEELAEAAAARRREREASPAAEAA